MVLFLSGGDIMKENDIKNAGKAITITTVLTLFIAAFEMVNALGYYTRNYRQYIISFVAACL
jgi:hypothetical protein